MLLLIDVAATDVPLPLKEKVQVDSLTDMIAAIESCGTQAQVLLAKTKEILGGSTQASLRKVRQQAFEPWWRHSRLKRTLSWGMVETGHAQARLWH